MNNDQGLYETALVGGGLHVEEEPRVAGASRARPVGQQCPTAGERMGTMAASERWDAEAIDNVMLTPAVDRLLGGGRKTYWALHKLIGRHLRRDWGNVSREEARRNDAAERSGAATRGVYPLLGATIVFVVEPRGQRPRGVFCLLGEE